MSTPPSPIRLLIAEDHALLADALQLLLGTQPDMRCLGIATDGEAALQQTLRLAPDVLLLDLGLPKLDGLRVMEQLALKARTTSQGEGSATRVLVVTARLDEASIRLALALGAHGYMTKDENSEELMLAIRRVATGRRYISAEVARLLVTTPAQDQAASLLTASERHILNQVGAGLTSRDIGERLNISEATVRKHRENIRRKLGIHNSAEMAAYAMRLSLRA